MELVANDVMDVLEETGKSKIEEDNEEEIEFYENYEIQNKQQTDDGI